MKLESLLCGSPQPGNDLRFASSIAIGYMKGWEKKGYMKAIRCRIWGCNDRPSMPCLDDAYVRIVDALFSRETLAEVI